MRSLNSGGNRMDNVICVQKLKKHYGKDVITKAVDGVSFDVKKGEFLCIMGPSGSGKSTLLTLLAGLDRPTSGNVILNNRDIFSLNDRDISKFRKEHMGFIFQELNLLDTLTLYENVELVLEINKMKGKQNREEIVRLARKLGIENIMDAYPYKVSGGQRQRCACIRAIVHRPDVIFADEPTGALDSVSRKQFMDLLVDLAQETSTTIVMVTHDINVARYSNRVLFLKDGLLRFEVEDRGDKDLFVSEISRYSSE